MTRIESRLEDNYFEISISGHANYDEYGKDIVCSGISTLAFSLNSYLESATDRGMVRGMKLDMGEGYIGISAYIVKQEAVEGIRSILCGFKILSENYEKYVVYSPKGREIVR